MRADFILIDPPLLTVYIISNLILQRIALDRQQTNKRKGALASRVYATIRKSLLPVPPEIYAQTFFEFSRAWIMAKPPMLGIASNLPGRSDNAIAPVAEAIASRDRSPAR